MKSAFISNIQMKSTTPKTKSTLVSNIQIQSTFQILKTTLVSNIHMSITPTPKSTLVSSIKSTTPIFSTKTQSLFLSSSILSSFKFLQKNQILCRLIFQIQNLLLLK